MSTISGMDRVVVNAAIEKLIAGEDQNGEAARVVVAACASLPRQGPAVIEYSSSGKPDDGTFTGHTQYGDVTTQNEQKEEAKEWSFGVHKERIGYYKVWREKTNQLCIQYFWGSDLTTQSDDEDKIPPCYYLGHEENTPLYFGVEVKIPVLHFCILGTEVVVFRREIKPLYGVLSKRRRKIGYSLHTS